MISLNFAIFYVPIVLFSILTHFFTNPWTGLWQNWGFYKILTHEPFTNFAGLEKAGAIDNENRSPQLIGGLQVQGIQEKFSWRNQAKS